MRTESIEKSEQPVLGARPSGGGPELGQFGFESFGSKGLATAPRTRIADDLVDAIVDGDRTGVGLQRETAADEAMGHAVAIAVELQAQVFVNQRLDGVAIILRNDRQRAEGIGLETIDGALSRFAVQSPVGDLVEPLTRLAVHVVEIEELAQRPEVLTDVTDAAFHFSLFPAARLIAGARIEVELTGKGQKARIEANQSSIMFGDGGGEIVIPDLAGDAASAVKA